MFNILDVDDNDSIRKLIKTYLLRDRYNVFAASDGLGKGSTFTVELPVGTDHAGVIT